jgi:hypothetical protein
VGRRREPLRASPSREHRSTGLRRFRGSTWFAAGALVAVGVPANAPTGQRQVRGSRGLVPEADRPRVACPRRHRRRPTLTL